MFEKLKAFLNHQRYQVVFILVVGFLLSFFYSCSPKVLSIHSPPIKVSREGLDMEVESFLALASIRYAELERQDELRQLIFENAIAYSQGIPINPIGIATTIAAIFGIGATVDNVRRRKTENKLKSIIANKS